MDVLLKFKRIISKYRKNKCQIKKVGNIKLSISIKILTF